MKVVVLLVFAMNTEPGVLNVPTAYVFSDRVACEFRADQIQRRASSRAYKLMTECVDRVIE